MPLYLQRILHIRWRRWLTERFLRDWLDDQAYYRMQLNQATTDNPDQRIAEDLNSFATITLGLSLGLLSAVVTLVSFLSILWTLSGSLTIPLGGTASIAIPGYMVLAALIYAVIGTVLTRWIGQPLVRLNFDQQRYEADFRFSMVQVARKCRERRLLRWRGPRARHVSNALCPCRHELVGHHQTPEKA